MSETESVVMRLFKFSNINASSIRTIMVADCLNDEDGTALMEKETDNQSQSSSQAEVKAPTVSQEVAVVNEPSGDDENKSDQAQKKKLLSKVQSIQVYENGCLCTKFVEVDDEEFNDKINGTIEYSSDYRMAEGPSCIDESEGLDSNTDTDGASSRTSSEASLHNGSNGATDNNSCTSAAGHSLANIEENISMENITVSIQEDDSCEELERMVDSNDKVPDMVICSFDDGQELIDSSVGDLNTNESAQFSYEVSVDNVEDGGQEDILNLQENVSYDVEFDHLWTAQSHHLPEASGGFEKSTSEAIDVEFELPEASGSSDQSTNEAIDMDATSNISYKRILHGQQQLQGSKFCDPSTSDLESDSPRDQRSVSSQSFSIPSTSALCTEPSSFCCVDYKKLRKSTKSNENSEKTTGCIKREEMPSGSGWDLAQVPGTSASTSQTIQYEQSKGVRKIRSKKSPTETYPKIGKSEEMENIILTTKTQQDIRSPQSDDKYLIFTKGSETYTPHQIGIKRIKPMKAFNDNGQLLPNVSENTQGLDRGEDYYDEVDHLIDMDGHIIGMCLSPDQR